MQLSGILLIDDDVEDLQFLSDALNAHGVEKINCVSSAREAFTYLEKAVEENNLPSLIVTDHYLRDIPGTQFISDLAVIPAYKHIPIMVLSTQGSPGDKEKYRSMGVVEFVIKPSDYEVYLQIAAGIKERLKK